MRADIHLSELYEALAASRSGYYARQTRRACPRSQQSQHVLGLMKAIYDHRHTRSHGSPRMTDGVRDLDLVYSKNRVARLMRRGRGRDRENLFGPRPSEPITPPAWEPWVPFSNGIERMGQTTLRS